MIKIAKLTRVQRYISPLFTWGFAFACQNRKAVSWGIRNLARELNKKERDDLRKYLNEYNIILPKFSSFELRRLEHYHIRKLVTSSKLVKAAGKLRKKTKNSALLDILPEIVEEKISGRLHFTPRKIESGETFSEKLRILREIKKEEVDEESWEGELIDQAFVLALRITKINPKELVYRMRKMAEIGGGIREVIASLFMDMPIGKIHEEFSESESEGLLRLSVSIEKIVQRYQHIRNQFDFGPAQITEDEEYIDSKMGELMNEAQTSKALLLFFLHKLIKARKIKRSQRIHREIRYLYAPLAERLGLIFLADDFRDQVLRIGDPKLYKFIVGKVYERINKDYKGAKNFLSDYVKELSGLLQERLGPEYQGIIIKFRVKSSYSIWNKVEMRGGCTYENINDILGIKIICDSDEENEKLLAIRDILTEVNDVFLADPNQTKEVLGKSEEEKQAEAKEEESAERKVVWRGIKLVGEDVSRTPIEIQLMTNEMNAENNRGKRATWIYNLLKELRGVKQVFKLREPKEVMTLNFSENFYEILKSVYS